MSLAPSGQACLTAKHLSWMEVVAGWCRATIVAWAVVRVVVLAIVTLCGLYFCWVPLDGRHH